MTFSPSYIHLAAPPFPYFLECDRTVYQPGDQHPNRNRMGKFDLIIVEQGTLFIGEDEKEWEVAAGHTLLLLPDRYHYAVKPCEEITTFVWIHFHTVGNGLKPGRSGVCRPGSTFPAVSYTSVHDPCTAIWSAPGPL